MHTRDLKGFKATVKQRVDFVDMKRNLEYNIGKWAEQLPNGQLQFRDLENTRNLANSRKKHALKHLAYYLEMFEYNAINNGIKVLWAQDSADALNYITQICKHKQAKIVVKSKSMVTEEIGLNAHLEKLKLMVYETDLGEFIQQLCNEAPIHILTPAMHRSKEEVANIFHDKLKVEPNLSPKELTKVARNHLRSAFAKADIGITGANFILPDIGGIAITENEGNARLVFGLPKVHIAVVGIEKILPSYKDLALFWPLLATYGTGQYITSYSSIITGAKKMNETDGPEEMYVILLDNKRTTLHADADLSESLACIRCGACLNVCPIYKNVAGGHAYRTTYTGPIGSVISPYLRGLENFGHLSYASTLCGACGEICPVKIPLPKLLHKNRKNLVQKQMITIQEGLIWKIWSMLMLNPKLQRAIPVNWKNFFARYFMRSWNKYRAPLRFAKHSFREKWNKQELP